MNKFRKISGCILSVCILSIIFSGCTVGPDFRRPTMPEVSTYTVTPLPDRTVPASTALGDPQQFVSGGLVNPQWWQELGSPRLDILIGEALQANPTLAGAQATLRQMRELYAAQAGATLYPQVNANLDGQRQKSNPSALGLTGEAREFSFFNAGMVLNYTFDLSGGNRRSLEALAAKIDYQRYQLEGAQLTLAANVVSTAVTQAKLTSQIEFLEAVLSSREEQLQLTRDRVRLGQAAPYEVLALETQVEETRAEIPLLKNQLQQAGHLLAVLAGRPPATADFPAFTLDEFRLPTELPLTVPSELLRSRPDIRAAEALLHAANAEYGVAVSKLYPQLNLSANLGSQALTTSALFGSGSAVWSLVGHLTQPLFNPGLPAEKRAALAALDAAAANYQNVVLESLRNVADVLRALENDALRLAALSLAEKAAQGSLESVRQQYDLGAASYIQLLTAQQQSLQTRIKLVEGQARRLTDSAALYQAMGG
ncbi:MAG: efflux transporter outer membrane subunit [Thermodesulfobacteriota bacterium]